MTDKCKMCANFIIKLSKQKGIYLSASILQKMMFYSYVEYAIEFNKPLFENEFYVWDKGPVIPDIYSDYLSTITFKCYEQEIENPEPLTKDEEIILANCVCFLINKNIESFEIQSYITKK